MEQGDTGKVVMVPQGLGSLVPPSRGCCWGSRPQAGCVPWQPAATRGSPWVGTLHMGGRAGCALPLPAHPATPAAPQSRHSMPCCGADSKLAPGPAVQVSVHSASPTAGTDGPTLPSTGLVEGRASLAVQDAPDLCPLLLEPFPMSQHLPSNRRCVGKARSPSASVGEKAKSQQAGRCPGSAWVVCHPFWPSTCGSCKGQ